MQSENLIKCAHPPCRCIVEVEDQFCSSACESKPSPTRRVLAVIQTALLHRPQRT
jgi:hypothetical protein